jgi:N-acetylglutamate synthase-like GNAT family acetyltransferase
MSQHQAISCIPCTEEPLRQIRLARTDEASSVLELIERSFRGRDFYAEMRAYSEHEVIALISEGSILVAESAGVLLGCIHIALRPDVTRLKLLAVSDCQRRSGVGTQLLETAERLTANISCAFVHVAVFSLHPDILSFFRGRGYTPFLIERFPSTEQSSLLHFVWMSKQLENYPRAF